MKVQGLSARMGRYQFPPAMFLHIVSSETLCEVRRVFIADADHVEASVLHLTESYPDIRFVLSASPAGDATRLRHDLRGRPNAGVIPYDPLHPQTFPPRIDLAVLLPPPAIRSREVPSGSLSGRYLDALSIEHAFRSLPSGARLIAVVGAGFLFSSRLRELRQWLAAEGTICSIRALPDGTLRPVTGIPMAVLEIVKRPPRRGERCAIVRYTTARPLTVRTGFLHNPISQTRGDVDLDVLRNVPSWSPDSLAADTGADLAAFHRSQAPKKTLEELDARIFPGLVPHDHEVVESADAATHLLLQVRSIQDGRVNLDNVDFLRVADQRRAARYEVREGDLVITSRGTALKLAVVPASAKPILISNNLICIRPGALCLGSYLRLFLDSPIGRRLLAARQRGTSLLVLSPPDLGNIPIPILPLDRQRRLVDDAARADAEACAAIQQADRRRGKSYAAVYGAMGLTPRPT